MIVNRIVGDDTRQDLADRNHLRLTWRDVYRNPGTAFTHTS